MTLQEKVKRFAVGFCISASLSGSSPLGISLPM